MMNYPKEIKPVLSHLKQKRIDYQIRTFESPAHHANEAAELLSCPLGAVVKSLVFQKDSTGEILLVLVSGKNRVDMEKLNALVGERTHPASPQMVIKKTGYPVGAVPPFGISGALPVFIDEDLQGYDLVWGSAGTVNILLGIAPGDLQYISGGQIVIIKEIS
jgi:Cys-tRNA(Pro) deacylase